MEKVVDDVEDLWEFLWTDKDNVEGLRRFAENAAEASSPKELYKIIY
jgi:hypothetical protein